MSHIRHLFFLLILLIIPLSKGVAQQTSDSVFPISYSNVPQIAGDKLYIAEDPTGKLDIYHIIKRDSFIKSTKKIPNLGVTASTFWFRLTISDSTDYKKVFLEVENPLLDEVALFTPTDSSRYRETLISKNAPFSDRSNPSQNYQFYLPITRGHTATFYLRIKSNTQLLIPVKVGSYESISNADLDKDLLSGLYFGIMLVMILYNLFVYFSVKDNSYLYYVLYIITVALVQLNITGLGFKYLWPNHYLFEKYSVFIFPPITGFASIAFIRQFLQTKRFVPRLHKWFWAIVAAYVFTIGNAFWGNALISYNLLNVNALILSFYMMGTAGFIRAKYKYRPALFFLIAWIVFLVGIVLFVLKDFSVLPYNLLTVSILQIGSASSVVLLSIALADRINTLQEEKKASQAEALRAAQENERIIREQNVILEVKVNERTQELRVANDDLNLAMTDLKEAQSQLVESEKMASLGQLTAGIAHEINNPINFVTSNVKPLKRDVEMLLDAVNVMEKLVDSDAPLPEKKKQIEEYKNDIDYDYLTVEINHLLKGIGEGASRTAEIVKGLRIFSRLDEDALKKADINEGLDSTLVITNNLLGSAIKIEKNYGNIPLIECYPGKLNQVFLNIVSNAAYAIKKKFEDKEGGVLTITTTCDENTLYIKIADNGTGMDENTKKKLFEPFFTTKDVGEGTGLGLSIVYNTINKHNGQIKVHSALGEGTEFILELPLIQK